jgi:hypothetical protein
VLAPKVTGAALLARATRLQNLDFFCLFSSQTAVTGSRRLAHYAAANSFLDGLAVQLRQRGVPAVSVDWGLWEEMHSMTDSDYRRTLQTGLRPMRDAEALAALEAALIHREPRWIVSATNWPLLKASYESRLPRPIFSMIAPCATAPQPSPTPVTGLAERSCESAVREELRKALGLSPTVDLSGDKGFFDLGLDSLMAMDFVDGLGRRIGRSLTAGLPFRFPNIRELSRHLEGLREDAPPPEQGGEEDIAARLRAALGGTPAQQGHMNPEVLG